MRNNIMGRMGFGTLRFFSSAGSSGCNFRIRIKGMTLRTFRAVSAGTFRRMVNEAVRDNGVVGSFGRAAPGPGTGVRVRGGLAVGTVNDNAVVYFFPKF